MEFVFVHILRFLKTAILGIFLFGGNSSQLWLLFECERLVRQWMNESKVKKNNNDKIIDFFAKGKFLNKNGFQLKLDDDGKVFRF